MQYTINPLGITMLLNGKHVAIQDTREPIELPEAESAVVIQAMKILEDATRLLEL